MSVSEWNGVMHEAVLSSRDAPDGVSVIWKIKNIALCDLPNGEIKSPKFYFSNAVWTLSLDGNKKTIGKSSLIDLCLNCETTSETVYDMKVKCLVADDSGVSVKSSEFTAECEFNDFWEYSLVPDNEQEFSFITKSNGLIIKFELNLNGKSEKQDTKLCKKLSGFSISDETCSLMESFGDAFGNKEFSDIIVRVGEEEIPAHKIILTSRSKVFQAMLAHEMKEIQDGAVHLKEIGFCVAKEMLRFMYTENVEALSFDKTLELYVAADKFDLQGLKQKCRDFLMEHLAFDNCFEVIAVADLHSDDVLAVRSREFFSANFKKVLQTEKWTSLENEKLRFCYSLLKEILTNLI